MRNIKCWNKSCVKGWVELPPKPNVKTFMPRMQKCHVCNGAGVVVSMFSTDDEPTTKGETP